MAIFKLQSVTLTSSAHGPGAHLQLRSRQASEDTIRGQNPGHGYEASRSWCPGGGQEVLSQQPGTQTSLGLDSDRKGLVCMVRPEAA